MENIDPSVYARADEGLLKMIEKAKVGALSEKDYAVYEASLKLLADEVDMEKHGYKRGLEVGERRGEKRGEKRGLEKGRRENSIQIATEMKKKGFDFSVIEDLTHISVQEIEKL